MKKMLESHCCPHPEIVKLERKLMVDQNKVLTALLGKKVIATSLNRDRSLALAFADDTMADFPVGSTAHLFYMRLYEDFKANMEVFTYARNKRQGAKMRKAVKKLVERAR